MKFRPYPIPCLGRGIWMYSPNWDNLAGHPLSTKHVLCSSTLKTSHIGSAATASSALGTDGMMSA